MKRIGACALLLSIASVGAGAGPSTQANYNDGKQGSPMQCRTFDEDPQGTKCARFCADLKSADKEGHTYCMCLPDACQR